MGNNELQRVAIVASLALGGAHAAHLQGEWLRNLDVPPPAAELKGVGCDSQEPQHRQTINSVRHPLL